MGHPRSSALMARERFVPDNVALLLPLLGALTFTDPAISPYPVEVTASHWAGR